MSRSPTPSDAGSHASVDSVALPVGNTASSHDAQQHQQQQQHTSDAIRDGGAGAASMTHSHTTETHDAAAATGDTDAPADAQATFAATAPSSSQQEAPCTSLFIGLGPAARVIAREDLRRYLQSHASNPDLIGDVRLRGRCAFADVKDVAEANRLVTVLDGEMYEDKCRLAVQLSKNPRREDGAPASSATMSYRGPRPGSGRYDNAGAYSASGRLPSLFIGLGPAGEAIPDHEIRAKLEEAAPLTAFRRRGQCAFVEVANAEHAERLMSMMNNQYIGQARISVQYSRDNYKRDRDRAMLGTARPRDEYYHYRGAAGGPAIGGGDHYVDEYHRRGSGRDRSRSRSRGRDEHHRRRHHRYRSRSRSDSVPSSRDNRRRRRHRSRSASTTSSRPRYASRSRSHSRTRARSPVQGPSSRASSTSRERRGHRHRSARHV